MNQGYHYEDPSVRSNHNENMLLLKEVYFGVPSSVYNVTGGHKDSMRVDLCGTTLTGLAVTWYADEVEAWN